MSRPPIPVGTETTCKNGHTYVRQPKRGCVVCENERAKRRWHEVGKQQRAANGRSDARTCERCGIVSTHLARHVRRVHEEPVSALAAAINQGAVARGSLRNLRDAARDELEKCDGEDIDLLAALNSLLAFVRRVAEEADEALGEGTE